MSTELSILAETQIARRFGKLVSEAVEVIEAASRAPELDRTPDAPKPDDMTTKEWNIAKDALCCTRDAPLYLTMARDRVELAQKLAGLRTLDDQNKPRYVIHTVKPVEYDVVDVTVEEPHGIMGKVQGKETPNR